MSLLLIIIVQMFIYSLYSHFWTLLFSHGTKHRKVQLTDSFAILHGNLGVFKVVDSGVTHTSSNNAVVVKIYCTVSSKAVLFVISHCQ